MSGSSAMIASNCFQQGKSHSLHPIKEEYSISEIHLYKKKIHCHILAPEQTEILFNEENSSVFL